MKCEPSEDDPLGFDGPTRAMPTNSKGTMINWKEPFLRKEVKKGSFFDFFDPLTMPDPVYIDAVTQDMLKQIQLLDDFAIGTHICTSIIPKAVFIFTDENGQEDLDPTPPNIR